MKRWEWCNGIDICLNIMYFFFFNFYGDFEYKFVIIFILLFKNYYFMWLGLCSFLGEDFYLNIVWYFFKVYVFLVIFGYFRKNGDVINLVIIKYVFIDICFIFCDK